MWLAFRKDKEHESGAPLGSSPCLVPHVEGIKKYLETFHYSFQYQVKSQLCIK